MEEEGRVIEAGNDVIKVEVESASCEKCEHFQVCNPTGSKKTVEIKNDVAAKVGDRVVVSISSAVFSRVAMLVYGVPVIGLIAGFLVGERITGSEPAGVVSGCVTFVVVYIFLMIYDKKVFSRQEGLNTRVTKVITGGHEKE